MTISGSELADIVFFFLFIGIIFRKLINLL